MEHNRNQFRPALLRATFPILDGAHPLYFALPVVLSSCLLDMNLCPYLSMSLALPPNTTPYTCIYVYMYTHVYICHMYVSLAKFVLSGQTCAEDHIRSRHHALPLTITIHPAGSASIVGEQFLPRFDVLYSNKDGESSAHES